PEAMSAFCASSFDRQDSSLCTMSWSEPCEAMAKTAPPREDAMDEVSSEIGLPSKTNRFGLPDLNASLTHPPPIDDDLKVSASIPPRTYRIICATSTQTTVLMPPMKV